MKSQKQTNKAPRPFKTYSERGGSGSKGTPFIPPPKFVLRSKKSDTSQAAGQPTSMDATPLSVPSPEEQPPNLP